MATNLHEADLAMFRRLGIPPELLAAADVRRVTDAEARKEYGIRGGGDMAGIAFPYWEPSSMANGRRRWYVRIRRDHPDIEDGKEKKKYIAPYGDRKHLYFPPRPELFADISVPIVLVESEKAALALTAWAERNGRKMLALGLGGCWGWRGRVGITDTATGERVPEHDAIPDLNICRAGRKTFVLLDSNSRSNPLVQAAGAALVRQLRKQGAYVTTLDLPASDGVNGPDDYIGAYGDEPMASIVDGCCDASLQLPADGRSHKKSQASRLVELAHEQNLELFHAADGTAYASLRIENHTETWPTKSKSFRDFLALLFYRTNESVPNAQAVHAAIMTLDGEARFEGKQQDVRVRVAEADGNIYLDLGGTDWTVVEISSDRWRLIRNPPVRFRRPGGLGALPIPSSGGELKDELRPFLNVADEHEFVLATAWLVTAIRPKGPYPILYIVGEQGSAKSTTTKLIRRLIDPNKAELRTPPRDERDLQIAANNGHVVALDNISRLDHWLSDAMCRLATGGGLATRELYTDAEEVIFDAQRPQLMNGIEEVATRGDFMERAIVITLPPIPDTARQDEQTFWAAFAEAQPRILGALLDAASAALRNESSTQVAKKPRMADFCLWSVAAEQAMGFTAGAVLKAYEANRGYAHDLVLETSPIAPYLSSLVEKHTDVWTGTTKQLLKELNNTAEEQEKKSKSWPTSARSLAAQLRRLAPTLRARGISFTTLDRRNKERPIQLSKMAPTSSPSSPPSQAAAGAGSDGDDICDGHRRESSFDRHEDCRGLNDTKHSSSDDRDGRDDLFPAAKHGVTKDGLRCWVHPLNTEDWWMRGGNFVCGKCHPGQVTPSSR